MASGPPERSARERLSLPVIYAALFISGGAALVYEAAWSRMLHRVFGVSDQAIATVLAAFFLGLGAGAALGGRLIRRVRRPVLAYAALEVSIGALALLSLLLIPRLHSIYAGLGAGGSPGSLTSLRFALALALLLPPTLLMGATLPVMIVVAARGARWSEPATRLYAIHTLGATVGAGLTGLVLIPTLGTRITIAVAALCSMLAAATVAALRRKTAERTDHKSEPDADRDVENGDDPDTDRSLAKGHRAPPRVRLAALIAGLTGIAALAGEVLWTRVLRIIVMGTTQAFSAMLVNYLGGIVLGSLLAARWLARGRDAARLLAMVQTLLGAWTVASMYVAARVPRFLPMITEDESATPFWLGDILLVSGLVLFPVALLVGTSIPLCWRLAEGTAPRHAESARHAGTVLAANTLGGLIGSLAAGFWAVPAMGLEAALLAVMALHLSVASVVGPVAIGRWRIVRQTLAFAGPLALGAVLLSTEPSLHLYFLVNAQNDAKRAVLDGPGPGWRDATLFLEEGRTTTVTVDVGRHGRLELRNDGRLESVLYARGSGMGPEMSLLGGLPNLFAEPREQALVIGLGAGHVGRVLQAGPWQGIRVVELEEAVVRAARFMHEQRGRADPLGDPRIELVIDDGRAQLAMTADDSLDAVVSQPSHPWLPGSSALYTQEFFADVDRALRPGGVFTLWVSTYRVLPKHLRMTMATLHRVFPHVRAFVVDRTSLVLCASPSPLPFDDRVRARFEQMPLAPYFAAYGMDSFAGLVAAHELSTTGFPTVVGDAPPLIDDRPALEFDLAALGSQAHVSFHQLDSLFWYVPWMTRDEMAELPPDARVAAVLARLDRVETRPLGIERVEKSVPTLPLDEAGRAAVQGALAETRGELDEALAHYDRVEHAIAATRADRLRLFARQYADLLARSRDRRVAPDDVRPLLSAALATREPEDLDHALALARSTPVAQTIAYATAQTFRERGCEGVRSLPAPPFAVTHDLNAVDVAERCARRAGDVVHADYLAQQRLRVRLGIAERLIARGIDQVRVEEDAYAVMLLRLGLGYQPDHAHAASVLAHRLVARGQRAEAERYLQNAFRLAMAVPEAASELRAAAADLGIALPDVPANGAPP